jgi:hypothetical protein
MVVPIIRGRYPPVISPGIHALTHQFSKNLKNWFWYITTVLQKHEKVKEPTVLSGFFHETHWFCKVFEVTGTSGSFDSGKVKEPEPAVLQKFK